MVGREGRRSVWLFWEGGGPAEREKENQRGSCGEKGGGVGLGKENDGGTGCEIGGLCRRLKRKNLQNQRREGGGGSP